MKVYVIKVWDYYGAKYYIHSIHKTKECAQKAIDMMSTEKARNCEICEYEVEE